MKKIFNSIIISLVLVLSALSVSAARLPSVGADANNWGTVLNDYLLVAHDENGTLKAVWNLANFTNVYDNRNDRFVNENFTTQYDARTDRYGNSNFTNQLGAASINTNQVNGLGSFSGLNETPDNNITSSKIASGAVTGPKLGANAVTTSKIEDGTIQDSDINSAAAIALSKLASGSSAQIIVANSTGVPNYITLSGDATISNTGALTIASNAITTDKINDGAVTNGKLAGSIAASKLIGTDIATVGTITAGTWHGTTIEVANGGTGLSSYTTGDLIYSSGTTALSKLGIGAANTVLTSTGSAPQWVATTGSGNVVLATSPTLTTPTLGVASATSINKLTITAPTTGSTLTIADGKTLTASNTLTFTGTDASSVAFGGGGTVAYLASPTFTGNIKKSVQTGITAFASGGQASATAITADIAQVTTVATTDDSVKLPVAAVGMDITIINQGANSLNVFGQTGDGINAGGANAAYAVATLVEARCIALATSGATAWECQKMSR